MALHMGVGFTKKKKKLEKEPKRGKSNHEHKSERFMSFHFLRFTCPAWGFPAPPLQRLLLTTLLRLI